MSKLYILLLDNLNNIIEETNIINPSSYQNLMKQIKLGFKNLPENFKIFFFDKKNKEIELENEKQYNLINDILIIREIATNLLEKSIYEKNYEILPESSQIKLDEKYNCVSCSEIIKNEKPYCCPQCQNIFHEKCLKDWEQKCKLQNKILSCPNCRNESPMENWIKILHHGNHRESDANLIKSINDYKLDINMNKNIMNIKDKKIKELKDNIIKQNELIKKYEIYIDKTIGIFKKLLDDIYSMHTLLKLENNKKLDDMINKFTLNKNNLEINDISIIINEEFEKIKNNIVNNIQTDDKIFINNDNNIANKDSIENDINKNNEKENIIKSDENINISINKNIINIEKIIDNNLKLINESIIENVNNESNKIKLIYFAKSNDYYNLFGDEFVRNNLDNIELIINGKKDLLFNKFELKKGDNIIELTIKKKLTNLSHMLYKCDSLKNIDGLKYLDVSEVKDFSHMFQSCSSLSDITSLENWDVSNGTNFKSMFCGCSPLKDIKPLQKWNISKAVNLSCIFDGCSSLSDISSLQNWDVSNCNDFSSMFSNCSSLSDISPLQNWNVSNSQNFEYMFYNCFILKDLKPLSNWNVSKCKNFSYMFSGCELLSEIKDLQNWTVNKSSNFSYMFYGCPSLSWIKPLGIFQKKI